MVMPKEWGFFLPKVKCYNKKNWISFFPLYPTKKLILISKFYGIDQVSWGKKKGKTMKGILEKNRTLTPIRVLFLKKHLTSFLHSITWLVNTLQWPYALRLEVSSFGLDEMRWAAYE
jgi:hypothetical protein